MQTEGKITKHDPPSHYVNWDGLELDYECFVQRASIKVGVHPIFSEILRGLKKG